MNDNRVTILFDLFNSLCANRASRVDGLKLLTSMVTVLPLPVLQPFLPAVMGKLVEIASVALAFERHA